MLELPSVVPYFDLSLQHASPGLLRRMKRWGSGERFLATIDDIRAREPDAVFRSSFISGFPGETERDHEELLAFLGSARLEWAGFFPFSREEGTAAADMDGEVPGEVMGERLRELSEAQEAITAAHRRALVGTEIDVIVDGTDDVEGIVARSHREAPEIDGIVRLAGGDFARPGARLGVRVIDAAGPDLDAEPLAVGVAG
jgi:tRNA A37 methylthiotransferase MiaB